MKAGIVSFTEHGAVLASGLVLGLEQHHILCEAWLKKKRAETELPERVSLMEEPLSEWTKQQFQEKEVLIFIGAAGIAVRSIAPYIKSKKTDPAVIVLDEQGQHAISLLSGHMGGANALTLLIANITGANPVITTATDLRGLFAVDVFAAGRNLILDSFETAKAISAALVEYQRVGMRSAFPVLGTIPPELDPKDDRALGFAIDVQDCHPFPKTLHLIPKVVVLGIGCKKGTEESRIRETVTKALNKYKIFPESICRIVSIDLKQEEEGLKAYAASCKVPFDTYSAEELKQAVCEDGFTESSFVNAVTGVGNVCERAALLGAGAKKLLFPKTADQGVTVAAAVKEYTVWMED